MTNKKMKNTINRMRKQKKNTIQDSENKKTNIFDKRSQQMNGPYFSSQKKS